MYFMHLCQHTTHMDIKYTILYQRLVSYIATQAVAVMSVLHRHREEHTHTHIQYKESQTHRNISTQTDLAVPQRRCPGQ